eukprot:GHVR01042145.1.p1 GENE.GHVR01042145.1~~GHVR01042145.1.p1  ORF type:complete len:303 (+),score=40.87 GHVR01042145.1:71-979(+)
MTSRKTINTSNESTTTNIYATTTNIFNGQFIFAAINSSLAVSIVCTPFDVVKTHWQCYTNNGGGNTITTNKMIKSVYSHYGLRTFWKGLIPTLLVSTSGNVIFFPLFETLKTTHSVSTAAGIARLGVVFAVTPIEYIRTRLQGNLKENDMLKLYKDIRRNGLICLYRGGVSSCMRDILFSVSYWTTFSYSFNLITSYDEYFEERGVLCKSLYSFILGIVNGVMCTFIVHPLDYHKTIVQTSDVSVRGISFFSFLRSRGISGLFAGVVPRILRVAPACGTTICVYDISKHYYSQIVALWEKTT